MSASSSNQLSAAAKEFIPGGTKLSVAAKEFVPTSAPPAAAANNAAQFHSIPSVVPKYVSYPPARSNYPAAPNAQLINPAAYPPAPLYYYPPNLLYYPQQVIPPNAYPQQITNNNFIPNNSNLNLANNLNNKILGNNPANKPAAEANNINTEPSNLPVNKELLSNDTNESSNFPPASPLLNSLLGSSSVPPAVKRDDAVPAALRVRKTKENSEENQSKANSAAQTPSNEANKEIHPTSNNNINIEPLHLDSTASPSASASHRYAREFLLKFQHSPATAHPPANLNQGFDCLLLSSSAPVNTVTLLPSTQWRPNNNPRPNNSRNNANLNPNNKSQSIPNKHSNLNPNKSRRGPAEAPLLSDSEVKPLESSASRYRVLKDIPRSDKLIRQLNSILNKLTPEKFDILVDQVLLLDISNAALLRDCVHAVFEKALAEPNFSPVYAEFCVKLSIRLPSFNDQPDDPAQLQSFKRLLLNQCQAEFEQEEEDSNDNELSPEELIDRTLKRKRRTLGTIRFIGELFIRGLLASSIMKNCIVLLLGDVNNPIEEDSEVLCKLLSTVGEKLQNNKANQQFLDETFNNLNSLKTSSGALSSRIRFMLQDVVELRERGWVQRIKAPEAKKISEIHAEANTQQDKPSNNNKVNPSDKYAPGSAAARAANQKNLMQLGPATISLRPKSMLSSAHNANNKSDWETVGKSKTARSNATPKAANSTSSTSSSNSANHNKSVDMSNSTESPAAGNVFDLLKGEEGEAEETSTAAEGGEEGEEKSGEFGQYSIDYSEKFRSLIKEFCSNGGDVKELLQSLDEFGAYSSNSELAVLLLTTAFLTPVDDEKMKEKDRLLIIKLFQELFKTAHISTQDIQAAFTIIFHKQEDKSLDFPYYIDFLAQSLAYLLLIDALSFSFLASSLLYDPPTNISPADAQKFFTKLFQTMKSAVSEQNESENELLSFLSSHKVDVRQLFLSAGIKSTAELRKHFSNKKLDILNTLLPA
jgi:hypothetical protein